MRPFALLALLLLGCAKPTDISQYATPMRDLAKERTFHYGDLAKVGRPEVYFGMAPAGMTPPPEAWVYCGGGFTVYWNAWWLANYAKFADIDHAAAHEICRLKLRTNVPPCTDDEGTIAEVESCAYSLQHGLGS